MKEKISTTFPGDKVPKEGSQCICLSVVLIDSVFRTGNYCPQVFLEECKYIVKKKRCLNILLTTYKFVLTKKSLIKKILVKKNLIKNKSRMLITSLLRVQFLREYFR